MGMPPPTWDMTVRRFMSKITFTESCWNFPIYKHRRYGDFYNHFEGREVKAHRFSYELFVGKIPEGLQIDHLCENKSCVNPAHLDPVTSKENSYRGNPLIVNHARKTHCPKGHPYTPENTYIKPDGMGRTCRICKRNRR